MTDSLPTMTSCSPRLKRLATSHAKGLHIATDHSYSDHRIALQQAIVEALEPIRTR